MSVFVLCCYLGLRTAAGYHVVLDVVVSVALAVLYAGTFSGTVTAMLSGLFLSLLFVAARRVVGYRVLTRHGWQEHPPTFDFGTFWRTFRHG